MLFEDAHKLTYSHAENGYVGGVYRTEQAQRLLTWESLEKASLKDLNDLGRLLGTRHLPSQLYDRYKGALHKRIRSRVALN